jgi:2-desacetyl-2-hydroxyethyl bacteriochlorophyllide A dehydrogenase
MRALVLAGKERLVFERREIPKPGSGELLVRMVRAGICGSDIHAYHGLQPSLSYPCVMGHENVGVVEAINGDSSLSVGDRVVVDPSYRCGTCELCRSGRENICENLRVLGVHCDGGFAEYCVCGIGMAHKLPDGLDDDTAVFCEPMSIAIHALGRMGAPSCETALIIGAGPIGLAVLLAAKRVCVKTVVMDILGNRLDAARNVGADLVLDSSKDIGALEAAMRAATGELADVVFDTVSNPASVPIAERLVKRGGRVVVVGMANKDTGFHLLTTLKKELTIAGTRMTTHEDFAEALDLLRHTDPRLVRHIVTDAYPLSRAMEGIEFAERHPEKGIKTIITFE